MFSITQYRQKTCRFYGKVLTYIGYLILSLIFCNTAYALSFPLPEAHDTLVGEVMTVIAEPGDNFHTLGRKYNIGYYAMLEANQNLNPDVPKPWSKVKIPSQFILPLIPKEGIVINLSEMRLYYFPANKKVVYTYPIGVGRIDWGTPLGLGTATAKVTKPTWIVPESIRKDREKDGVHLPKKVLPGPDNPMGDYKINTSFSNYRIHGTNDPSGVGMRSSAGCIRMFPEDIKELFGLIKVGTPIHIIDKPYKFGWLAGKLYFEAHQPLQEHNNKLAEQLETSVKAALVAKSKDANADFELVKQIAEAHNAIPQAVWGEDGVEL